MAPLTLLSLSSPSLTFAPKFLTDRITVTNVSDQHVAFKVKTTTPKSYVVKPSYHTLRPAESTDVQITLQLQAGDSVNSHLFLVQAVPAPSGEAFSREQWSNFEHVIQQTKLSVTMTADKEVSTSAGDAPAHEGKTQLDDLDRRSAALAQETQALMQEKKKLEGEVASISKNVAPGGYSTVHLFFVAVLVIVVYTTKHFL
eukprot:CAMPEP_0194498766 /NCGR_PEP_ID=MMETSP0253-20130528/15297_1 /TAXON_ID=2966 /ORGANISM="Noctiluca scintillans" /LENGTH=199 /DNA_ID=CAMNT_0039340453 /DNA_START=39 /DNA_END=638 /DNA_ORIENTATION=-